MPLHSAQLQIYPPLQVYPSPLLPFCTILEVPIRHNLNTHLLHRCQNLKYSQNIFQDSIPLHKVFQNISTSIVQWVCIFRLSVKKIAFLPQHRSSFDHRQGGLSMFCHWFVFVNICLYIFICKYLFVFVHFICNFLYLSSRAGASVGCSYSGIY